MREQRKFEGKRPVRPGNDRPERVSGGQEHFVAAVGGAGLVSPGAVLAMQRAVGNGSVSRMLGDSVQAQRAPSKKNAVADLSAKLAIVTPHYASGDQFAVSAVLLNEPESHLYITYEAGDAESRPKAEGMRKLHRDLGAPDDRIHVKERKDEINRDIRERGLKRVGLGDVTERVARTFSETMRDNVRQGWGLGQSGTAGHAEDMKVETWLESKHVNAKGAKIAILWSRFSGKRGEIHIEHDTSYFGMAEIIAGLGKLDYILIVGDSAPKKNEAGSTGKYQAMAAEFNGEGSADHAQDRQAKKDWLKEGGFQGRVVDLTEFWKKSDFKNWGGDSRKSQFLVFDYLHRKSAFARHLGFRSGNLEAMALMGFTVRYMEEPESSGGDRMKKWHAGEGGKTAYGALAPGYERLLVEEAPTRAGRYEKSLSQAEMRGKDHRRALADKAEREKGKTEGGLDEEGRRAGKSRMKGFLEDDLMAIDEYLNHGKSPKK